ncbi:MAG: hypothetical protein ACKOAU_01575, partial [Pirellula sp.]
MKLTGGSFALALMRERVTSSARRWTALQAGATQVALVGVEKLQVSAESLSVQINRSASDNTIVDFAAKPLKVRTGPQTDLDLNMEGAVLTQATGQITFKIEEFVYISGGFAFKKSDQPLDVVLTDGTTKRVTAMTVGASQIRAFVGVGNPDSNGNGKIDSGDDPGANGADGLVVQDLEFGLALFKPTDRADRSSYFALKASAANITIVGLPGVGLQTNGMTIESNGASIRNSNGSTSLSPVINFVAPGSSFGEPGFTVITGTDRTIKINLGNRLVRASGQVTFSLDLTNDQIPDVSFSVFALFERTLRPDGTALIKVSLSNLSLSLGNPSDPILTLSGLSGLLLVTPSGLAGRIQWNPNNLELVRGGATLRLSGLMQLEINSSGQAVDETFIVDNDQNTQRLELTAGKYVRVSGSIDFGVNFTDSSISSPFVLKGFFVFEPLTLDNNTKVVRVAASNVEVSVLNTVLKSGQGGFVFTTDGIAGNIQATVETGQGDSSFEGMVRLEINTTGKAVDQTIQANGTTISIKYTAEEGKVVRLFLLNAAVKFPPFFSLTGNFTYQTVGDLTMYGAKGVEIFVGYLPDGQALRGENNVLNPNAIGLLISNATVGVVKWKTPSGSPSRHAIYAYGSAGLVGLDEYLTISGTVAVRINNSGQAIDKTISLPDSGDGQQDIQVKFATGAKVEEFSVGFNEQGAIDPSTKLTIGVADIVTLSGAVRFTRNPNGQVDVDMPEAEIGVKIPYGGAELEDAFSLKGAARFNFGGPAGFKLEDMRITGFSILGAVADLPTPPVSLRPLTADLSQPISTAIVNVGEFSYLEVVYHDPNRAGIHDGSILDQDAEFNVYVASSNGTAISGLTVNNAGVTKSLEANNDRTFRYPITMTQEFKDAVTVAGQAGLQVTVSYLEESWTDNAGAKGSAGTERFRIFDPQAGVASSEPAYATLSSPSNGSTINLTQINAKRYIDVTFVSPSGAAIDASSIDGNELRLSGAATANLAKNADGTVKATVMKVNANTWRYSLFGNSGIDPKQLFAAGDVAVEIVAGSWAVGSGTQAKQNMRTQERFTVSATAQSGAAASNGIKLGPLTLQGPKVGLAGYQYKDKKLTISIEVGVALAQLAFGGS